MVRCMAQVCSRFVLLISRRCYAVQHRRNRSCANLFPSSLKTDRLCAERTTEYALLDGVKLMPEGFILKREGRTRRCWKWADGLRVDSAISGIKQSDVNCPSLRARLLSNCIHTGLLRFRLPKRKPCKAKAICTSSAVDENFGPLQIGIGASRTAVTLDPRVHLPAWASPGSAGLLPSPDVANALL